MTGPADEAWNRYWREGRGAACQADDAGLYRGAIGAHWREFFGALPRGRRLLDLGCGNGALAALAAESAAAPLTLHGVDAADVRPEAPTTGQGVTCRLHARTRAEHLPFARAMFDGCVSQYGAEYGDLDATVDELARVLRPGGWIRWICHWAEGDIARDAADEADRAGRLRALELPDRIAALVRRQQVDGRYVPDSHRRTWHLPEAQRVKQGLSEGFRIARATPQQANGNLGLFLHNLAALYQHREQHPVDDMLERMAECDQALAHHRARLQALVSAALTPDRLAHLRARLAQAGLPMTREELVREPATGRLIAILLHAGAEPAATVAAPSAAKAHWGEYWREGAPTTFGGAEFADDYDGVVSAFWDTQLDTLPPGARIADLGTGNGALVRLLARSARRRDAAWTLIGIDAADIDPDAVPANGELAEGPAVVQWRGGTPIECTGLADASMDLCVAGFGLEYARFPDAALEIARILRPGGRLAALMHHPASAVADSTRRNVALIDELVGRLDLPGRLASWVRAAFEGSGDAEAALAHAEAAVEALARRGAGPDGYPMRVARHFLSATSGDAGGAAERLAFIERFTEAVRAWRKRMADMQQATLDDEALAAVVAALRDAGLERIDVGELRHADGALLGRTLTAVRG
jgi:ubiquinone/menaquinone biosynthesis C-methylase UbiE